MFFSITDGEIKEFSDEEFIYNDNNTSVGCISMTAFTECYTKFGFGKSSLLDCISAQNRFHSNLEVYDQFTYGVIHKMDLQHVRRPRTKITLFFRKNLFLLISHDNGELNIEIILRQVMENVGHNFTIERVASVFFTHLIADSNAILAEYETQITEVEKKLLDQGAVSNLNKQIFKMKNDLTIRRSYFEEFINIGETLLANENGLLGEENLRYLKIFTDKVQRLSTNTALLCENLVHLREAYQSAMDYSLNKTIKIFTVVTTIFLPLSLIVGWYGMNFPMPEFGWSFGYPAVVILCVAVVIFCLWFFKKKKLF